MPCRRRTRLVLVRTPVSPLTSDPYEQLLNQASSSSFAVEHVPILTTALLNLDKLGHVICGDTTSTPPRDRYEGVVITSARAVQAWQQAATAMTVSQADDRPTSTTSTADWSDVPFYVVGNPCKDALMCLPNGQSWKPRPELVLGASESGTGEKLANYIVNRTFEQLQQQQNFGSTSRKTTKPFLWLVGDKNRDTVPNILERAGFQAERLQVYETSFCQDFEKVLDTVLDEAAAKGASSTDLTVWIALFSPSGAKHCIQCLRQRGLLSSQSSTTSKDECGTKFRKANLRIKLAAIGPVTQTYLEQEQGLVVDAVAAKPEPQGLLEAISQAEEHGETNGV
ncbi:hypothetical protein ACM66B_006980 [Microbotryomycetes sp. NB124-2]